MTRYPKIKVAPTACAGAQRRVRIRNSDKDFGIALIDLHSAFFQVAACCNALQPHLSERELRSVWLVRHTFYLLKSLREAIPKNSLLRDVSNYYKKVATGWYGYWLHGFIPVSDFLSAIEQGLDLALAGDKNYTRPLRDLSKRFPYRRIFQR